jgi:beta-lactamase regulating signal transducer with metallopeptidase domain
MDTLLQIGIANAASTVPLAILVLCATLVFRRPATRHALWLLVLVKFVAPPLIVVPVFWTNTEPNAVDVMPAAEADAALAAVELLEGPAVIETELAPAAPIAEPKPFPWRAVVWGALAVWIAGASFGVILTVMRTARFCRLLKHAESADAELAERVEWLAGGIGLKHAPGVWLVPGSVSPMLWAICGRPRLLLPKELWDRMEAPQRDSLLLHELAHLRRRDHYVRLLELVVNILFWWHPVAWWARHNLREAEEQCCDAWVLWALPKCKRAYAHALLSTMDFLSQSPAPARLPVAASGMGEVHQLRRRLLMIKRGETPKALSRGGLFGFWSAAALLLPLAPSFAQAPPDSKSDDQAPRRETVRDVVVERLDEIVNDLDDRVVADVKDDDDLDDQAELKSARATVERLQAELAKARATLAKLERDLGRRGRAADPAPRATRALRGRVMEVPAPAAPGQPPLPPPIADDDLKGAPQPPGAPPGPGARVRPPRRPGALPAAAAPPAPPAPPGAPPSDDNAPHAPRFGRPPGGEPPAPPRAENVRRPRLPGRPAGPEVDNDRRLRDLEQKLDRLIEELKDIRKDKAPAPAPSQPRAQ